MVWIYRILLNPFTDRHLGYVYLLAVKSTAVLTFRIHKDTHVCVNKFSVGNKSRSGIAWLYVNTMFILFRNCQTVLHNYTIFFLVIGTIFCRKTLVFTKSAVISL